MKYLFSSLLFIISIQLTAQFSKQHKNKCTKQCCAAQTFRIDEDTERTAVSGLSNNKDLIERAQSGAIYFEAADLQANTHLTKALQKRKRKAVSQRDKAYELFKASSRRTTSSRSITKAIPLNLQKEVLAELITQTRPLLNVRIPVTSSASFELDLYKVNIHAPGYSVITSSPVNQVVDQTSLFYHGIIKGNPNSMVVMSLFEDAVDIFIEDNQGAYKIAKSEEEEAYLFYNNKNRAYKSSAKCGAHSYDYQPVSPQERQRSQSRSSCTPEVPIYIEVSHSFYRARNRNINSVKQYIDELMAQASIIYGSLGIPITISQLKINTTPESYPPGIGDETSNAFDEANKSTFPGRLGHFITTNGGGGGQADMDALCERGTGLTGISEAGVNTSPILDDLNTFVHELGHNFGAPHTQDCAWNGNFTALDGCEDPPDGDGCSRPTVECPLGFGTIMSYCQVEGDCPLRNKWHPQVAELIQAKYQAASCLWANDCEGTPNSATTPCEAAISFVCGESINGNNGTNQNTWEEYADGDISASGPEVIYIFQQPANSETTISLTNMNADLELIVLENCQNTATVLDFSATIEEEIVTIQNVSDMVMTRYIVVDGYDGAIGSYQLTCNTNIFESETNETDEEIDEFPPVEEEGFCEEALPFSCGEAYRGTNDVGQNKWDEYDGEISATGPEIMHVYEQSANSTITIELTDMSADLELIVLGDCNDPSSIIDYSATIEDEFVTLENNTNATLLRYIVVDGYDEQIGNYTLTCDANFASRIDMPAKNKFFNKPLTLSNKNQLNIYPNPARGHCSILYQLAEESEVQIDLFNAKGQLIKILLQSGTQDEGTHQIDVDAFGLQDGIYYTVLSTDKERITKRLVLLR